VSERLKPRLAGVAASAAIVVAAFAVAFVIALGSPEAEQRPSKTVHQAAAPQRADSRTVELRPVAALPALRPAPRPRRPARAPRPKPAPAPAKVSAAPAPTSTPAPVAAAPAPPAAPPPPAPAAPAPVSAPPPAPVRSEPPAPEPSFDSSGGFDSSG
jgi:hypothetical protein